MTLALLLACTVDEVDSAAEWSSCPSMCAHLDWHPIPATATEVTLDWSALTHDYRGRPIDSVTGALVMPHDDARWPHGCGEGQLVTPILEGWFSCGDTSRASSLTVSLDPDYPHFLVFLLAGGSTFPVGLSRSDLVSLTEVSVEVPDSFPSDCLDEPDAPAIGDGDAAACSSEDADPAAAADGGPA